MKVLAVKRITRRSVNGHFKRRLKEVQFNPPQSELTPGDYRYITCYGVKTFLVYLLWSPKLGSLENLLAIPTKHDLSMIRRNSCSTLELWIFSITRLYYFKVYISSNGGLPGNLHFTILPDCKFDRTFLDFLLLPARFVANYLRFTYFETTRWVPL